MYILKEHTLGSDLMFHYTLIYSLISDIWFFYSFFYTLVLSRLMEIRERYLNIATVRMKKDDSG